MTKSEIHIGIGETVLSGALTIPDYPIGLVIFSPGSGSSRSSPRNQFVAAELNKARIATLLLDLLTPEEEEKDQHGAMLRFDIDLLTERLASATLWCRHNDALSALRLALFGASTGAASALRVAAQLPTVVAAVVSRGGRPDMAMDALATVACPVLLIVGGEDHVVIELNRRALAQLKSTKRLDIVPRATHLFDEAGTLEVVARKACDWFAAALKG